MSALLVTGPVGVGKTTVASAVGDLLATAEVPHAVIDLADLTVIHQRLIRRHLADEDLRWHLRRVPELERIFDLAPVEDFSVAADHPVPEVAKTVASEAGWL